MLIVLSDLGMAPFIIGFLFIIFFVVLAYLKTIKTNPPRDLGELRVEEKINHIVLSKSIHDIIIEVNGHTHQIDHILIHPHGIFVIETKNYAGMIYGDEKQDEWTQVLADGEIKHQHKNPIKQNRGHIFALSQALKPLGNYHLKGLVVFAGSADISHITVNEEIVTTLPKVENIVQTLHVQDLNAEEIDKIYRFLWDLKAQNTVTQEQHIASINARHEAFENHKCPRCGGQLVVRNGQNGPFYGCSNYPDCTFKKKIS